MCCCDRTGLMLTRNAFNAARPISKLPGGFTALRRQSARQSATAARAKFLSSISGQCYPSKQRGRHGGTLEIQWGAKGEGKTAWMNLPKPRSFTSDVRQAAADLLENRNRIRLC